MKIQNAEHLKDYFRKSGDAEILPGKILQNEHGFIVFRIKGDTLTLVHVYGNGEYWQSLAEKVAQFSGCKRIVIGTSRSPRALTRRYGYRLIRTGYIMEKEL